MTTLTVGTRQQFDTIQSAVAAASSGDVIKVQAGTYVNDFATIRTSISLEAVGGMVHLLATTSPPDGKAILTLGTSTTSISISGFEFSGAAVSDQNGSGIRYEGGSLTLVNDYFHDNQEGLLATPGVPGTGSITIRNSEFARNGAGDGYSHNIYVGSVAQFSIDGSYIHDANVGHEVKSRAASTTITNSRIIDGNGTASYSIDLPNGGSAMISGNVIQQGQNSQNPIIVAYGEEGSLQPGTLTLTGNTIVNALGSASSLAVWNATSAVANITSNTIAGLASDRLVSGPSSVLGTILSAAGPVLDLTSPITDLLNGGTGQGATPATPTQPTPPVDTPAAPPVETPASPPPVDTPAPSDPVAGPGNGNGSTNGNGNADPAPAPSDTGQPADNAGSGAGQPDTPPPVDTGSATPPSNSGGGQTEVPPPVDQGGTPGPNDGQTGSGAVGAPMPDPDSYRALLQSFFGYADRANASSTVDWQALLAPLRGTPDLGGGLQNLGVTPERPDQGVLPN